MLFIPWLWRKNDRQFIKRQFKCKFVCVQYVCLESCAHMCIWRQMWLGWLASRSLAFACLSPSTGFIVTHCHTGFLHSLRGSKLRPSCLHEHQLNYLRPSTLISCTGIKKELLRETIRHVQVWVEVSLEGAEDIVTSAINVILFTLKLHLKRLTTFFSFSLFNKLNYRMVLGDALDGVTRL